MTDVAVVTSTIGRRHLVQCIESVLAQTRKAHHYIFVHGKKYNYKGQEVPIDVTSLKDYPVTVVELPFNNGDNGFGMAPVYAAAPYIVREEVICYLDDDNFYDSDHIETNVGFMQENGLDWAYALRRIVDKDGTYVCDDLTESLGVYANCHATRLVDNSCFIVKTKTAQRYCYGWMQPIISDRGFLLELMTHGLKCGGAGKTTVNYRISEDGSNPDGARYFLHWNRIQKHKYQDVYPWMKETVFQT